MANVLRALRYLIFVGYLLGTWAEAGPTDWSRSVANRTHDQQRRAADMLGLIVVILCLGIGEICENIRALKPKPPAPPEEDPPSIWKGRVNRPPEPPPEPEPEEDIPEVEPDGVEPLEDLGWGGVEPEPKPKRPWR